MDVLIIGIRAENMQPPNPSDQFLGSFTPGSILHLRPGGVNKIIGVFLIIDPNLYDCIQIMISFGYQGQVYIWFSKTISHAN